MQDDELIERASTCPECGYTDGQHEPFCVAAGYADWLTAHHVEAASVRTLLAADYLAGAVCEMIDLGVLDARSIAGDALLDYAQSRYGSNKPEIDLVRTIYNTLKHR